MAYGRKTGGRTKGAVNKKTLEKRASVERVVNGVLGDLTDGQLDQIGPREALTLAMRWAIKAGALPMVIEIATILMPYHHAKKAPVQEKDPDAPTPDDIAADEDPEVMG